MNKLLNHIIEERNGHYCHALELANYYEYENIIEQIVSEYKDSFTTEEIIDFFNSIDLYYYTGEEPEYKEEEEQLYNFDYIQCIIDCYY